MNKQQIDRLMRIARKTGSPVIILDEDQSETVLLPLSTYEQLIDASLSEVDFFDDFADNGLQEEIDISGNCDMCGEGMADELGDLSEIQELPPRAQDAFSGKKENNAIESEKFDEEQFYLEPVE
ncbi:MAG: hypothetical protein ABIA83_02295 [Patescibacteria group bacterium]